MSAFLLSTKFYIPRARANSVSRPRLTEKLLELVDRPGCIGLLSGPAGFGKTTLLSEFVGRLGQPVAWLSLDEGDNDPIRFWTYLITACQSIQNGIGETALALFQMGQPFSADTVQTILINDIARSGHEMVLILDDYHVIQNQSIHAGLVYLFEHSPAVFHILLSTRVDPPWPLARWRARNQLIELRAVDLRFSSLEALDFLNRVMDLSLTRAEVEALEARTEGWIAGLQLAALSMQERADRTAFVKAFTGSNIYVAEYLMEEVLQHQAEDIKMFLLQTSILERLSAGLCEAVNGCRDAQAILAGLQRANLFVLPLDDEGHWFRYHHLFADLLKARLRESLDADAQAALHRRAAAWHEQAGMLAEAIEHSLAAMDYTHAVQLVEKTALPMILQAYVRTVEGWLQAIPARHVAESPRINMAFVWLNFLRGTLAQADPYLEQLANLFTTPALSDQAASLQAEWLAIQSRLRISEGKPLESRDLAIQALKILPEPDAHATHVRSMLFINLAMAYQQMLDYEHAAETFQLIVRDAQASGNFVAEMLGVSGQAQMLLLQGQLRSVYEIVSQGIERLESSGRTTPFSATLYSGLGLIHFHWHEFEQACQYSLRSIQASGLSGYSDSEIYHHILLSRIAQMDEDWQASAREIQQAGELARLVPPAMVQEELIAQQVRVHLALNHSGAAQDLLKAKGFSFGERLVFPEIVPGMNITHSTGVLYNSALRVLLFQAREKYNLTNLIRGLELADIVLAGELRCRQIPIALETLLLRSQMQAARGDEQACLADVTLALGLAEPEGFISTFVEEGLPIAESLAALLGHDLAMAQKNYIQKILAAFPQALTNRILPGKQPAPYSRTTPGLEESLALTVPLTARELEVLQLIACGDSNQTIARKLVITLSAVKKHTGNIFNKLLVKSRTQALARARQLGLITTQISNIS